MRSAKLGCVTELSSKNGAWKQSCQIFESKTVKCHCPHLSHTFAFNRFRDRRRVQPAGRLITEHCLVQFRQAFFQRDCTFRRRQFHFERGAEFGCERGRLSGAPCQTPSPSANSPGARRRTSARARSAWRSNGTPRTTGLRASSRTRRNTPRSNF